MSSRDTISLALFRPPIILIVEGAPAARSVTCHLVRALGYEPRSARDGHQALRMLRQYPTLFHLVLTNVVLPDMDAGELARQAGIIEPGIRVAVIAEYVPLGKAARVIAACPELPVVRKPVGFRELYDVLTPLLGPARIAVRRSSTLRPPPRRTWKAIR
jgi:CheY-like chemotaxis protein